MGSIKLLNAVRAKVGVSESKRKGHLFIMSSVSGLEIKVLLDTGASHNFIEESEAMRLHITYVKELGCLKTINSAAKPIYGIAQGVRLHIGNWCGLVNFSVVNMDDFKMVLGIEFIDSMCTFPIAFCNTICIMGESDAHMVPMTREASIKVKTISAMQVKKVLKKK